MVFMTVKDWHIFIWTWLHQIFTWIRFNWILRIGNGSFSSPGASSMTEISVILGWHKNAHIQILVPCSTEIICNDRTLFFVLRNQSQKKKNEL